MKIYVAKDAGYCFGVRDAVNLAKKTADEFGEVYMLGHIVHNEFVVKDLEKSGTRVVESLEEVPEGKPIMFRAHGTETSVWEKAEKMKMNIIDATCPLVKEIHDEVKKLEKEGRQIIIVGDHGHDEVVGIASQVNDPIIVSTPEEASELRKFKKAGLVTQSTQRIQNVQEITNILMTKVFDLRVVNTICYPTKRNHEQIIELSEIVDLMIVIGSYTSANSKRLTSLALARNKNSHQVTNAKELKESWFENVDSVGISAGASTPDNIIMDVINKVKEIGRVSSEEVLYG